MRNSTIVRGGVLGLTLMLILTPGMCQSAITTWTNASSSGGAWSFGAETNWSTGLAPSNNFVYITNAVSKTVTVDNNTPTDFLVNSNLYIGAPGGATNTIVISGNTSPFVLSAGSVSPLQVGTAVGRCGSLLLSNNGLLVTSNSTTYSAVGFSGTGVMTVASGRWVGYSATIGYSSGSCGLLNLNGGTNELFGGVGVLTVGQLAGSVGMVNLTGGVLVTTNGSCTSYVGRDANDATMNVSGGTWLMKGLIVGNASGSSGRLNISGSGTVVVLASSSLGSSSGSTGTVVITGGVLDSSAATGVYIGSSGVGALTLSGGSWLANSVRLGDNSPTNGVTSKGTLTISGGEVRTVGSTLVTAGYVAGASNNTILVTGGLLDANSLLCPNGGGNIISNAGGVYQFSVYSSTTPAINTNGGPVVINGGTIAFRDVAAVDVNGNQAGSPLTNMSFTAGGKNAFRLNNATNATSGQTYTFASNPGAANYTRLELVNATNCYRGGNVTIGTGGSILFSNTIARLEGSLTNSFGTMEVVNSAVTITGACTLAENTTLNWTTNAAGNAVVVNVGGVLNLPTNATVNLNVMDSVISRDTQLTLFTAANITGGSPANWQGVPLTHRMVVVGNTNLVLRPRATGFVIMVK
ncbi:MAG: hypothetical protein WCS52_05875 [bacterium]